MEKKYLLIFLSLLCSTLLSSQNTLSGILLDGETGEELIGVNVVFSGGGTVSEYDGSYSLDLPIGEHEITFSYVGYRTKVEKVNMGTDPIRLDLKMSSGEILTEVNVTADIAIERKTPVAFSNIPTLKIQEELAAQDIPMILNSTPGAYATAAGGGDGDARITIRGFNQRNVAVMLDGIPVNDMENGWVFWSNWFGLDLVTQTMQVQRGLGASKLAIPSIGGTINILTKGIDAKQGVRFRQEIGNDGYLRSTFGLTTGRMKNGWGISVAGSYKEGDGWVEGNFTQGYFYYLRVDKQIGKHLISFSGFGAPQEHGQRPFTKAIATYSAEKARDLGIPEANIEALDFLKDRGLRFNEFVAVRDGGYYNTRQNYYHKPQFSLRHSLQANEKMFFSNVAYLSIGNGGGVRLDGNDPTITEGEDFGRLDLDEVIRVNSTTNFAKPDTRSEGILRASVNNHFWYGLLSTMRYDINDEFTFSGGVDLRSFEASHHREVRDLLGGSYYRNPANLRVDPNTPLYEGDKFDYDNKAFIKWGGLFGLLEYEKDKWSIFTNLSASYVSYRAEDFMKAKVITIEGQEYEVTYNLADEGTDVPEGPVIHNSTIYTVDAPSEKTLQYANDNGLIVDNTSAQNQIIDWLSFPGFTFKTGAAFNFREDMSVFANAGYLSKAQRFINAIRDNRNNPAAAPKLFENISNEKVWAVELGYKYKSPIFSANLNSYFTYWNNKPLDSPVFDRDPNDPEEAIPVNVNGIAARHMGIELDFAFKPIKQLSIEGLASIGDWIWASNATWVSDISNEERNFYPDGVHVGDAAQIQYGGLVRYEPIKGLYIKANGTFFGKNFSNFSPESLENIENAGRESWQLPNYFLVNFHTGYSFKVRKSRISLRFNIINLLNTEYISDGNNNDGFGNVPNQMNGFDAQSASVHFGQGRRWSSGFTISF